MEYLTKVNDNTVQEMYYECKFGFGQQLKYETESEENNVTQGKVPLRGEVQLEVDDVNGQPKLDGKRNHR